MLFSKDVEEIVLQPIENMLNKVEKIAKNPLEAAAMEETEALAMEEMLKNTK